MKYILRISFAIVMVGLVGCRGSVPIRNIEGEAMPEAARHMTNQQISETISKALGKKGFHCGQATDNQLTCTRDSRGHEAKVAIKYSQQDFSIHRISTRNLKEENGKVHPSYNKWVVAIKREIIKAITTGK